MTLTLSHLAGRARALVALVAMAAALTAAVLLQGAAPGASSASSSAPAAAPAPTLSQIAASDPTRPVQVIVQFASKGAFERGRSILAVNGATVTRDLHIISAYGARMSAGNAQRLTANPAVRAVSLNAAVKTSSVTDGVRTSYLESARVDKLWGPKLDRTQAGTGRGVGVAVIDTGIDGSHPDFRVSSTDASNRVVASVVTNPLATTEDDEFGHGTHVAGLIAGNGFARPTSDPLYGKYVGAAPNANLVSIKVSDDNGETNLIDVIYGLQFAVDHKADYNIRVANLSLSAGEPSSYVDDPLDAAVESAWKHGIVVVAAAGNRGTAADAVSYAPGNDPYVITVGGVDTMGTKRTSDDQLASWSSRGTTQDGFAKPEVVAPGAHMVSAFAAGSAFGSLCPSCITDGQYFKIGGTSMAAAVVSGVVADLLEVHPDWTPDQVKGALMNNLRRIDGGTRGEVDAEKASRASRRDLVSNTGLTPNALVDPATGDIDYTRASWSRASWSQVDGDRASWSRASWSRASWSRASWSCDCEVAVTGDEPESVEGDRASWSRASWSRASWSRASWSRASWSASFSK